MKKSIRLKFFIAISITALIFVGILEIANWAFFDNYYIHEKKTALENLYTEVSADYDGEVNDSMSKFNTYENKYGMRIRVISGYYITYDTNYTKESIFNFQSGSEKQSALSSGLNYKFNEDEYKKKGYSYMTVVNEDTGSESLCLLGSLSDGSILMPQISMEMMQDNVTFSNVFIGAAGLLALLVSLLVALMISKRFTRPIVELSDIATSMASLDFSKKYQGKNDDELGQLGENINLLSYQLDQSINQLQQANEQLKEDIRQKEKIDEMRKEFIINASHELKTPIALIQGYGEGLLVNINSSEEDKNYYCQTIIDEAKYMNKIVMELLELSKLEAGKTELDKEEVDAYQLVEELGRQTLVMQQEQGIQLDLSGVTDSLYGDEDQIHHLIMNYLTNAIYHTPKGGTVRVYTEDCGNQIRIAVYNDGEKIPADELERIWDKFYKTNKAHTREHGGTGIGLSIVRAIVESHGGQYGVRNLSKGVEFYALLPKRPEGLLLPEGEETESGTEHGSPEIK